MDTTTYLEGIDYSYGDLEYYDFIQSDTNRDMWAYHSEVDDYNHVVDIIKSTFGYEHQFIESFKLITKTKMKNG